MLTLLSMTAWAVSPEACDEADLTACKALFRDAAARAVDATSPSGLPDPRYESAVWHFGTLACRAGDLSACLWVTGGESRFPGFDPTELGPSQRPFDDAEPAMPYGAHSLRLPDGSSTFLSAFEIGRTGAYLVGAEGVAVVGDALYVSAYDATGIVRVAPDGDTVLRHTPADGSCGTAIVAPISMEWTSPDCEGPYLVVLQDHSTGESTTLMLEHPPRLVKASQGSAVVSEYGRLTRVDLERGATSVITREEAFPEVDAPVPQDGPLPPWLQRPHPHVPFPPPTSPLGPSTILLDEQGEPVVGAYLDGEWTDSDGAAPYRTPYGRQTTRPGTLFVDGVPRQARVYEDGRLHLLPARTTSLPALAHRLHSPSKVFGVRTGPRELQMDAEHTADGPIRVYADAHPEDPVRTASRAWELDPAGGWQELDRQTFHVVDESRHPLAGLTIDVDGEPTQHTSSKGEIEVWGRPTLSPMEGLEVLPHSLQGDHLVLLGPPAQPAWTPDLQDPTGAWHGLDEEGRPFTMWLQLLDRTGRHPDGMGEMGLFKWFIHGGEMLGRFPDGRLRRRSVGARNTAKHFSGTFDVKPGERVTLTVGEQTHELRFSGTSAELFVEQIDARPFPGGPPLPEPLRFTVRDGLLGRQHIPEGLNATDERLLRAAGKTFQGGHKDFWLWLGGPLHGVELKRGESYTEHVWFAGEDHIYTWTFTGREPCGDRLCAVIRQRMDGLPMTLLLEPATLRPHRLEMLEPESLEPIRLELDWH